MQDNNPNNKNTKPALLIWIALVSLVLILCYFMYFISSLEKTPHTQDIQANGHLQKEVQNLATQSHKEKSISHYSSPITINTNEEKNDAIHLDDNHISTKNQTALMQHNIKKQQKTPVFKPKVAIIIDDLAIPKHIRQFNELGFKINLSLFPKHSFSIQNPQIAQNLDFYMIHLPLEAHNFKQQGVEILRVGDSSEKIESYIKKIKQDFPNLRYLNNHTGSRYTESKEDMQKFLAILDRYNVAFIDSRTTPKSIAAKLAKEQGKYYLARNVFLDNKTDISSITKQLLQTLKIADKRGHAIAIGHPNTQTLQVLKTYKDYLIENYDLVYISELEEFFKEQGIYHSDEAMRKK